MTLEPVDRPFRWLRDAKPIINRSINRIAGGITLWNRKKTEKKEWWSGVEWRSDLKYVYYLLLIMGAQICTFEPYCWPIIFL